MHTHKQLEILQSLEILAGYYHSAYHTLNYMQKNPNLNCTRYTDMARDAKEKAQEIENTAKYLRRVYLNANSGAA